MSCFAEMKDPLFDLPDKLFALFQGTQRSSVERTFAAAAYLTLVHSRGEVLTSGALREVFKLSQSSAHDRMIYLQRAGFLLELADVMSIPEGKRRHFYVFNLEGNREVLMQFWLDRQHTVKLPKLDRLPTAAKVQAVNGLMADPEVRKMLAGMLGSSV